MKQSSTIFLKLVIFLIGLAILSGLLWFPQVEGRNAHSDPVSLYFNDPFLAYIYLGSMPFFIGLYQATKLLGYIEKNKAFSKESVKTLRIMKYCSLVLMGFIGSVLPWIFAFGEEDNSPGVVLLGVVAIFIVGVLATALAVFQKLFQNAVDIKEENDLTV